jgi:hypothetical protein
LYSYDDATQTGTESYGPQVAYLVSPQGIRYELTGIDGEEQVYVAAWDPQASTALALAQAPGGDPRWALVDLTNGALTDVTPRDVQASQWTTTDLDSLWWPASGMAESAPDGPTLPAPSTAALPAADKEAAIAMAKSLVPSDERCEHVVALESGTLVVVCGTADLDDGSETSTSFAPRHYVFVGGPDNGAIVSVATTREGSLRDDVDTQFPHNALGEGVVADTGVVSVYGCPIGVSYVSADGVAPLRGVEAMKAVEEPGGINIFYHAGHSGTSSYTATTGGCSGEAHPAALVRDDVASGEYAVLIPFPAWWAENPYAAGQPWPGASVLSAYVVPDSKATGE